MAYMPLEFIKPQLATAVDHPPPRAGWIHEVKHDGYRTLLIIERHKARYPQWLRLDRALPRHNEVSSWIRCRSAIIDGSTTKGSGAQSAPSNREHTSAHPAYREANPRHHDVGRRRRSPFAPRDLQAVACLEHLPKTCFVFLWWTQPLLPPA